jgi:carbamoyl-phosphate synthase/aspartate carbamoyltransferase
MQVQVFRPSIETIIVREDIQLFTAAMEQIDKKGAQRASATMTEEAILAAAEIGYPVIVCAAYVTWRCVVYLLYCGMRG